MVTKLFCNVPQYCGISRDEASQQNDWQRNIITMPIILRQLDEVLV